jgi:hypothetical protein
MATRSVRMDVALLKATRHLEPPLVNHDQGLGEMGVDGPQERRAQFVAARSLTESQFMTARATSPGEPGLRASKRGPQPSVGPRVRRHGALRDRRGAGPPPAQHNDALRAPLAPANGRDHDRRRPGVESAAGAGGSRGLTATLEGAARAAPLLFWPTSAASALARAVPAENVLARIDSGYLVRRIVCLDGRNGWIPDIPQGPRLRIADHPVRRVHELAP